MPARTPAQTIREARNLASNNGCFVSDKDGKWLVYRKTPVRLVYLGQRSTPAGLYSFVRKLVSH